MAHPHILHESSRSLVNLSASSGVDWSKEDQPWIPATCSSSSPGLEPGSRSPTDRLVGSGPHRVSSAWTCWKTERVSSLRSLGDQKRTRTWSFLTPHGIASRYGCFDNAPRQTRDEPEWHKPPARRVRGAYPTDTSRCVM